MPIPRQRPAFLKEAGVEVTLPVYSLDGMPIGPSVSGPCLIQEKLTVTLIPAETQARITRHRSNVIDLPPPRT